MEMTGDASAQRGYAERLAAHRAVFGRMEEMTGDFARAADAMAAALAGGARAFFFGNGGSAADAQHWAAELTGRFERNRRALAGIALTTDSSALTAIANDFGFERTFARQIEALARPGDVAIGISTSGGSANVIAGLRAAEKIGCATIAITGEDGGAAAAAAEIALRAPARDAASVQECHGFIGHALCAEIERRLG